eukprot:2604348-Amphidinium_carterae.1
MEVILRAPCANNIGEFSFAARADMVNVGSDQCKRMFCECACNNVEQTRLNVTLSCVEHMMQCKAGI